MGWRVGERSENRNAKSKKGRERSENSKVRSKNGGKGGEGRNKISKRLRYQFGDHNTRLNQAGRNILLLRKLLLIK